MTWQPLFAVPAIALIWLLWLALSWLSVRPSNPGSGFPKRKRIRLTRRVLLGTVLAIAMLGPAYPAQEKQVSSNVEILLVIDRTGSMTAEDWEGQQPRLEGVKRDVGLIVDATPGARYSVVTWDSFGRLELPVTTDSSAVVSLADILHQEVSEFSSGSSLNRPLPTVEEALTNAKENRTENVRFLVVFSDGENTDETDPGVAESWRAITHLIDGGAVIGYGTEEGAPMKVYRAGEGQLAEYMLDPDSAEEPGSSQLALARIDPVNLARLAEMLKVPLLLNPDASQVVSMSEGLMEGAAVIADGRETVATYRYAIWPLGMVGAALVIWELLDFTASIIGLRRSSAI